MSNSRFSPNFIATLMIKPLRYFFSNYAGDNLKYNDDELKSKISINTVNNFHKIALQEKPRILVDRGDYRISGIGLSDNMAEGTSLQDALGLDNRKNMVFINGAASLAIETKNEGTCELITDMVSHFFVWSYPYICNTQGFKSFAMPLTVSRCMVDKEDTEIFRSVITAPYTMEEMWQVNQDALKLKDIFTSTVLGS